MKNIAYDVAVIGAGPGGYTAAFRAADLGLQTVLINEFSQLGGVCLNVGCIPSKTLLHVAELANNIQNAKALGINVDSINFNLTTLNNHKNKVINQLSQGLSSLAQKRNIDIITGYGQFLDANNIIVTDQQRGCKSTVAFNNAIIATGSSTNKSLINLPTSKNIIYSTAGLEIKSIPKQMLIIGGGIIGLEMAEIYSSFGANITIIEQGSQLIPAADADLVKVLQAQLLKKQNIKIYTNHIIKQVTTIEKTEKLLVQFSCQLSKKTETIEFDKILVAVGRTPNSDKINADKASIAIDKKGFIQVNSKGQTNIPHIYAVGDVVSNPMLAHKASYEAKIAANNCAGIDSYFEASVIPSIAYTNPELAWVGLTEKEAKDKNIAINVEKFPWIASGRALANDANAGFTKIIASPKNNQILGGAIVGQNAGELLAEITLAIETASKIEDLTTTIHPHPTLSETIALTAEMIEGTITDLYLKK